ncbi:hypothetical protein B0H17DRAFT_1073100 [Mycena rosella]|uniref:Uncharacterized protein n=1 Tax=Mycena rosella TaxID=1033263 RepID=A0AAD7GAZ6_MYCRO|nr:hypothetical protein B0H17DRAFT_1073100 [Mycena rosella]
MPRPSTIALGTLPIVLAAITYYQHLRLRAAYPTLRVPPAMEISARRDTPAFGMSSSTKELWMHTHAGDMWTATVPRRLLSQPTCAADAEDPPEIVFARAFWSSWPLKIERRIVHALAGMGTLFEMRGGAVDPEGENRFVDTARILGGLFVVEAQKPLVTSWWLRPQSDSSTTHKPGLLGGYHTFAVKDAPSSPTGEPSVQICFVSHLILSIPAPPAGAPSIPSNELTGLSLRQRLIMHFHALYARILLDLAVRALERRAS